MFCDFREKEFKADTKSLTMISVGTNLLAFEQRKRVFREEKCDQLSADPEVIAMAVRRMAGTEKCFSVEVFVTGAPKVG